VEDRIRTIVWTCHAASRRSGYCLKQFFDAASVRYSKTGHSCSSHGVLRHDQLLQWSPENRVSRVPESSPDGSGRLRKSGCSLNTAICIRSLFGLLVV